MSVTNKKYVQIHTWLHPLQIKVFNRLQPLATASKPSSVTLTHQEMFKNSRFWQPSLNTNKNTEQLIKNKINNYLYPVHTY